LPLYELMLSKPLTGYDPIGAPGEIARGVEPSVALVVWALPMFPNRATNEATNKICRSFFSKILRTTIEMKAICRTPWGTKASNH